MAMKELFEKDKSLFRKFDNDAWFRYYSALNKETPVEKVKGSPFYLELSDGEKACYVEALKSLKEDRKICPEVRYEVRLRDLDD